MKKLTVILTMIAMGTVRLAQAQGSANPFISDANGRPLYLQTSYRAEGSPYYHDGYMVADITTTSGKVYPQVNVKFNVQTNEVLYVAQDGQEMVATLPIRRIRFIRFVGPDGAGDRILESVSQEPLNVANTPVYDLADSGRISVLKQIKVTYTDVKEFNQASVVRNFKRKETWHLRLPDGTVAKLETSRAQMTKLLQDKAVEITTYIDKEGLKCRSVDECRKVIRYYNTL